MYRKKIQLLIIDPQNDFCEPNGALYINGAKEDMIRLSSFINTNMDAISEIHVTMDSHRPIHIAHPIFWINEKNEHPNPFTIISFEDYKKGKWRPTNYAWIKWVETYLKELEEHNRYLHYIWPPHCIIGTWGHALEQNISNALIKWEMNKKTTFVNYIAKGSNSLTEHYSAYKADVEIPEDTSTLPNFRLKADLEFADEIYVAGEALSHCVANTIRDFCAVFSKENIAKITILKDLTSNIKGFEKIGENFLNEIQNFGVKVINSTNACL